MFKMRHGLSGGGARWVFFAFAAVSTLALFMNCGGSFTVQKLSSDSSSVAGDENSPSDSPLKVTASSSTAKPGEKVNLVVSGGKPPYTLKIVSGGGSLSGETLTAPMMESTIAIAATDAAKGSALAQVQVVALALKNMWTTVPANASLARYHHNAVWTGSRMVIWGGAYKSFDVPTYTVFNDGASYEPVAGSWTAIASPSIAAREMHTGVWTGSRMIVWGGCKRTADLQGLDAVHGDGAVYDPATNSWSSLSLNGAPSARYAHVAVWTGSKMIVWGGTSGPGSFKNDGAAFDPITGVWTPISMNGAPSARAVSAAVWTGTKMIIWGGLNFHSDTGPEYFNDGGIYDPATDSWSPLTSVGAPSKRESSAAFWTGSKMVIWGGQMTSMGSPLFNYYRDGGVFDPATNTWSSLDAGGAPAGNRADHSAVWTGEAAIFWGGTYSNDVGSAWSTYDNGGVLR